MQIDILTLFPEMFQGPFSTGLFQRAVARGLVSVQLHDIREYTHDRHRTVDDYPYGGGAGMVLKPEPIFEAVEALQVDWSTLGKPETPVVLLTPQGYPFSQKIAWKLSEHPHLILLCGRYEGVDERIREHLVTEEISIGDYVISGGELAAMVVVDAIVRLLPGVLGSEDSPEDDSHNTGLLEYPHYTRPPVFRDWSVPDVLLSGNHSRIAAWRREQSIIRTLERRPDLLNQAELRISDEELIERLKQPH
jgi:tRNA (guanine37-N1)-methyltransferase